MRKKILLAILFCIFCFHFSFANEEETDIPNILGVGVLVYEGPYKGINTRVVPTPLINWREGNIFVRGRQAGVIVGDPEYKPMEFSLILEPRFMGYKDGDSDFFGGMQDRDNSLDAGIGFKWMIPRTDSFFIEFAFLNDIFSNHEGREAQILLTKLFDFKPFYIEPEIGVEWQSEDLTDYYYGVRASEAIAGRPAYSADSALNTVIKLNCYLALSEEWLCISRVGFYFLDDEISDSPLVDESHTISVIFGIARMF